MILPDYKVEVQWETETEIYYFIHFDKIIVMLLGSLGTRRLEMRIDIKKGCRRRNVSLLKYLNAINDYLISNKRILSYKGEYIDILNSDIVKFLHIRRLKLTSGEFEYIKEKFPNLLMLTTENCTIYDKANPGVLTCVYKDIGSDITSLDSFNGFSGRNLHFHESHIINNNKHLLHLYNVILMLDEVDIDYETFLLTLDAPNLRKITITKNKRLTDNDLLFISGLYNLESIKIDAIINSAAQLKKLERLREMNRIVLNDPSEMKLVSQIYNESYDKWQEHGETEEFLLRYLRYQAMRRYKNYFDFLNDLYVRRIDRVIWENKISVNDIEKIRQELIAISKMFYSERRKIARENKEITLRDQLDGLYFGDHIDEDEEVCKVNSGNPFDDDSGIDYYVKRKKIILDR